MFPAVMCWRVGEACSRAGCYPCLSGGHLFWPATAQQSFRALQTRAEAEGRQSQRGTTKHIHWSFILFTDKRLQGFIRFVLIVCFMRVWQECETWLNVASSQEEYGMSMEEVDQSYTAALNCAERAAQSKLQVPHSPSCSTFIHRTCVQNAKNSIQTDC